MSPFTIIIWLALVALPVAVVLFTPAAWPRWGFMWLLASAIFVGCKWLTWASAPEKGATERQLGYLFLWPGLDAPTFLLKPNPRKPALFEWWFALAKFGLGVALIVAVIPRIPAELELLRGWVGMIAIVLVLHFGLFHLLSLIWRSVGVTARPLMDWPVLATSVSDFWGRRWNTAFRDLTHRFLFRPITARRGAKTALLIGFLGSGLLHDLVISLPAGSGFGGPTAFFLIQAGALLFERSALGNRLGLARGLRGWAFTMFVLLAPLPLLFHPPFVRAVVTPLLDWIVSAQAEWLGPLERILT